MGQLTLSVAGRTHHVACRDGEEGVLRSLAAMLERHAPAARAASGGSYERTLLYVALMLAEQLAEREADPHAGLPADLLDRIAERLEAVAQALEDEGASS